MTMPSDMQSVTEETKSAAPQRNMKKAVGQWVMPVLWIAVTFVCAGRLDWVRGWICIAAYFVCLPAMSVVVRRRNPALIEARANWRRHDTKPFDKVLLAIYLPLTFIQPAVA